jgi:hypothetical protein
MHVLVVPAATPTVDSLGAPLPAAMMAASVASGTYPNGYIVPAGGGGGTVQPPPAGGPGALTLTEFPAPGVISPIAGKLSGVTNPQTYKIVMYLTNDGTTWYARSFLSCCLLRLPTQTGCA